MVFLCSVEFCFSLFISYLFLFRVLLVCFVFFNSYLQLRSVELFSATDNKYFSTTNSLKFSFSLFCPVLLLAFFFPYLFLFRILLIWFVFLQLLAIEKRLADFSDRQQILLKTPTMQLNKVYHGKLSRQNRNKMGEDPQRKLTANHQQFNNWIKQLIGLEWNSF